MQYPGNHPAGHTPQNMGTGRDVYRKTRAALVIRRWSCKLCHDGGALESRAYRAGYARKPLTARPWPLISDA
jgi:hypothetical protein